MRRAQAGVSLLMVALVLILIAGVLLAAVGLFRGGGERDRSSLATASLTAAQTALEQFAGSSSRLPCPADPAQDTGESVPAGASAVCNFPSGTVPWKTIGMRRDDAYDPWGMKISYRVYAAAAGGLTQADGASMVQCDSNPGALNPGTTATGLCRTSFGRHTGSAAFLAGKGLSINDFGTNVTGVAYVLISHGPSGLGAWPSGTTQRELPLDAAELANTTAAGPFIAQAASAPTADPRGAPHFDDVLAYRTIAELAQRANITSRDWPEPAATTENATLNTATLTESIGIAPSYGDLQRETITLGNSTITAFDSGGNQNLSFDTAGGNEGIGGAGGGSNGLSETGGEGVRISLAVKARFLGVSLNDFGYLPAGFPFWRERVQFRFIDSATAAAVDVTKQGCSSDGGLASFATIDAGFDFDTIEVRALTSTSDPFFGTTIPSSFFLSAFRTCSAGAAACSSALETPGNLCP